MSLDDALLLGRLLQFSAQNQTLHGDPKMAKLQEEDDGPMGTKIKQKGYIVLDTFFGVSQFKYRWGRKFTIHGKPGSLDKLAGLSFWSHKVVSKFLSYRN